MLLLLLLTNDKTGGCGSNSVSNSSKSIFDKSIFNKSTFDISIFNKSTFDISNVDKSIFDKSTFVTPPYNLKFIDIFLFTILNIYYYYFFFN